MFVLGFNSIYDIFIAIGCLVIFVLSLAFGFTILLAHSFLPRGCHHRRRGDCD
jgi:hypothetical protein